MSLSRSTVRLAVYCVGTICELTNTWYLARVHRSRSRFDLGQRETAMANDPKPADTGENEKKPYRPPRLEVYGDIREIATVVGMKSTTLDGALHGMAKTS